MNLIVLLSGVVAQGNVTPETFDSATQTVSKYGASAALLVFLAVFAYGSYRAIDWLLQKGKMNLVIEQQKAEADIKARNDLAAAEVKSKEENTVSLRTMAEATKSIEQFCSHQAGSIDYLVKNNEGILQTQEGILQLQKDLQEGHKETKAKIDEIYEIAKRKGDLT